MTSDTDDPALSPALTVLLYASPLATVTAFILAQTVATCLFHEPSPSAGRPPRRLPALLLQLGILGTVLGEGATVLTSPSASAATPAPAQAYNVYLILQVFTQVGFAVGIAENAAPLWYPYVAAWAAALLVELPLLLLQAGGNLAGESDRAAARTGCEGLRVAMLLLQVGIAGVFLWRDRGKVVRLDAESEALLAANADGDEAAAAAAAAAHGGARVGHAGLPAEDSTRTENAADNDHHSSSSSSAAASDDPDAFDDEDKADRQRKKEQQAKMRAAGSIWHYLQPYKLFIPILVPSWRDRLAQACLVIIGLVIVAERIVHILAPRQLGILVDALTAAQGTGAIPVAPIGLWVLYTWLQSSMGIMLIKYEAELVVAQYAYKALSTRAFSHIMSLSMDFHTAKSSGELIAAMEQGSSLHNLAQYIFFSVAPMFVDLFIAFFYVYTLFDVYMALILLGSGIAYTYLGVKLTGWGVEKRRALKATQRTSESIQNEAINNWPTVSHFNRGAYESARFATQVTAFNKAEWWYTQTWYLGGSAQSLVLLLGQVLGILLAAHRVAQGQKSVGDFVTLNAYWHMLEGPLESVQYSVRQISGMLVDSERLLQLLSTKPSVTSRPGAPPLRITAGAVTFDAVSFAYDPRKPTLTNISFSVQPGQTVALVGETGGGKSTLLKLLYRYYDVTSGSIQIDGQDIRSVDLDSLRESFALVPQDPALFNASLWENLRYARLDATDAEIRAAAAAAAIDAKIMSFPDGYRTVVGERGMKLSGGELQRVAIARAILRDAPFVLLDEATSQIDAETESKIQAALGRLTKGRTTFVVAHRLSTVQNADVIVVIGEGGILQCGTHEELFRVDGKYRALWAKQLSKEIGLKEELEEKEEKGEEKLVEVDDEVDAEEKKVAETVNEDPKEEGSGSEGSDKGKGRADD